MKMTKKNNDRDPEYKKINVIVNKRIKDKFHWILKLSGVIGKGKKLTQPQFLTNWINISFDELVEGMLENNVKIDFFEDLLKTDLLNFGQQKLFERHIRKNKTSVQKGLGEF